MYHKNRIESLYDLVTGDEDARVCRDIPAESCNDQPRNFFAYLVANVLGKIADEISSARLVLPWLVGALGAPAIVAGMLVPIREAGVLLPQLLVAARIRALPLRKPVWILGAGLSGVSLAAMALVAWSLQGAAAGWALLAALTVFSVARGLCSVAAKDVLGKTVSKSRRGNLMGIASGIAGVATLGVGLLLGVQRGGDVATVALLLGGGALLWLPAIGAFAALREQPGATSGGGNALAEAIASLAVLRTDAGFRHFVLARALLLGLALAPPFFVLLAQQSSGSLAGLGMLVVAGGLAGSVSAPLWGRLGDRSARLTMALAAAFGGLVCTATWLAAMRMPSLLADELAHAVLFGAVSVAHGGVRLGRKVYLVDMASGDNRATLVAVSNTVIGVVMLLAGSIGFLGDAWGAAAVIGILGLLSLGAALYATRLPEVSA